MQSLVNNMSSSMQSVPNEEDISSSHVDTDKPLMCINPSLTYSVAGISRDLANRFDPSRQPSQPQNMVPSAA